MQWKLLVPGLALAAVGALGGLSEHLQVLAVERHQAEQAHDYHVSMLLPRSPQEELTTFHSLLVRKQSAKACNLFAEPLRPVFAQAHGTTDCVAAMDALAGRITDPGRYELPSYDTKTAISVQGDRATVDACAVSWPSFTGPQTDAGPRLGQWQLVRQHGNGYLITGWQGCAPSSTTPPAVSTPSSSTAPTAQATTTSAGPRWLPTYPTGYPGVLATAIGRRDTSVCDRLFTETGRAAFARVVGVGSCADAVTALANQVTDAANYGQPHGAVALGGDRRVTVDACSLTWISAKTGSRPPGPQLGQLVLETQDGEIGYLIVGFQSC